MEPESAEHPFVDEYLGHAVGLGVIWLAMSQIPLWMVEYWAKENRWLPITYVWAGKTYLGTDGAGHTTWTRYAFQSMAYGTLGLFGV